MKSECKKYINEIIGLKKPTGLDKLAESIPKPKGAIPNFGLPKWKVMPLESKIPMVPGPEGAYNFTRRKLGKELWIPAPAADFNLSDPYCYEMELTYDSLHDKHLVPYFSRPRNIRHLIKAGLVTKSLDAMCSLRDYNMYRKYLRKIHCDNIKKELKRRSKWDTEEKAILYAQKQAQNEEKRLRKREKLLEIMRTSIKRREQARKLKLQKQKEEQQKIEERLIALKLKKQEDRQLQFLKSKAKAELIQQKQKAAIEHERHKIISVLVGWTKKERVRKKTREMRLVQEREEKRQKVEKKWQERQEFQKKQMEKEQLLLQCIEDQRRKFIEAYNEKIENETRRMQKLLKNIKIYMKCYFARHYGGRERICCVEDTDDDEDRTVTSPMTLGGMKRDKNAAKYPDKDVTKKGKVEAKKKTKAKKKKEEVEGEKKKKKKKKPTSIKEGGKKKARRKKKKKQKKEVGEEEKIESIGTRESESTMKTDTSETTLSSAPSEKCRCQAIREHMKIS
nr:golgin subfamily A member 6-like protein 6 [Megalopta genalis]XP_033338351.1 golgin subfamily A member 6-like protein 6 [Megalopta genalis]